MMLRRDEYRHYRWAVLTCLAIAAILALFVAVQGKQQSFLAINGHFSRQADYFFTYVTYLGDGLIWVPLFLYVLLRRKDHFVTVLAALIICTFLTHFGKRVIFVDELRPLRALQNLARPVPLMHGRDAYINSFPSGHTSTAFTLALLLALIVPRSWAAFVFPVVAFLVGYSRVYLAQHFVTDVLAGLIIGIISSYLSILIFLSFQKKKAIRQSKASP